MQRHTLGATGISVSEFALGAMMFGQTANADEAEAVSMIHCALDAEINFIDTADVYSKGESETIVGKALRGRRDQVVLSTKGGLPMDAEPNHRGGSRRRVVEAVEASLRRLDTDYIDLYFLHRFDPETDLDETLAAMSDLVRDGKIRAIGSSLFSPEQTVEAQWVAERRGHRPFRVEQSPYSILLRGIEGAVLPTAQKYGMGVMTFGPLSSGWLSGRTDVGSGHRATMGAAEFDLSVPENQAKLRAVEQLTELAGQLGVPLTHLATAFVRSHPAVTSVLIGPRRPEQLDDLLGGTELELTDDILDRIDEIVPPGANLNQNDIYYVPTQLGDKRARRRASKGR
jgi:aryl-alcohol dehydrogenase-like predicted oxidoreductase